MPLISPLMLVPKVICPLTSQFVACRSLKRTQAKPLHLPSKLILLHTYYRQMTEPGFEPRSCFCPSKYCSHFATEVDE